MDEALDHAVQIMTEQGVGALTISEVARRMGIGGPSLYKYFPSLHAVYDLLFARGGRKRPEGAASNCRHHARCRGDPSWHEGDCPLVC